MMRAGFFETDITPEPGVQKIGWMEDLRGDVVLDPLSAVSAVFESGENRIGFIQLDILSINTSMVKRIREEIERTSGFPGANIMISATHNHAGPAAVDLWPVRQDEDYAESLVESCVRCFSSALEMSSGAELGYGSANNFEVAHNRRCRLRDGTVRSQTWASRPDFLCIEGPVDPEVAVLAAREPSGKLLGCLVNYACHPNHHGGENAFSAGFPGVMRKILK